MIQQLDFFRAPTPVIEQPVFILADNSLVLVPPAEVPVGPEAAERKAARLREIEDRKAAKAFEGILNGGTTGGSRWRVSA